MTGAASSGSIDHGENVGSVVNAGETPTLPYVIPLGLTDAGELFTDEHVEDAP